ncbi:MAG TPA: MarR family transcriptional regulator [Clostridia bacterium]|nr:MarR family transcriptional regulator [Clostridia bacterium]
MLTQNGIAQLNGPQGRILHTLWNGDGLSITELAETTGLTNTTLTGMLDRLETAGFLRRAYDKSDRRKVRIRLTDTAVSMRTAYLNVSEQMNAFFYKGFSSEEIQSFERTLARILVNLTKEEQRL